MVKWPVPVSIFDSMAIANRNAADPALQVENYVQRAELALHHMLRREFELLPVAASKVTSGAQGRALAVANHAEVLLAILDLHWRGEVEAVWPLLVDRCHDSFEWPERLMLKNHGEISTLLDEFVTALQRWHSRLTADARDDFIEVTGRLTTALYQHLAHEEELVVPLMNQHITAGEFEAIMETQAFNFEPSLQTLLLGMLMYEGDSGVVDRASATIAAAAKRRAANVLGKSMNEGDSGAADRASAAIAAAVRRRAATQYVHHCWRVHGTVRPRVGT